MRSTFYPGRNWPRHRHNILAIYLTVAYAAAVAGCSSAGDEGSAEAGPTRVTVTDSSGVEIVSNRGPGWTPGHAWRLEPDLQVGELDGPLAFGRISWVGPGPDGGILVLDGQAHLVHVFDSVGRPIRSFGGEGDGPGEFRRPAAVTALDDGRFAVGQGFPPVLHWLAADGDYLSSTRLPIARDEAGTRTAGAFGIWQVTSSGRAFVQVQVIDPGADDGEMPVVLLEVDPSGGVPPDTVARWTWQAGFGDQPIRMFEPIHTWMPRSDGTIVMSPGRPYEIQWREPASGLARVTRRAVEPVPVTRALQDRALADMREGMETGGASEEVIDDMLGRAAFEETMPDVMRVWVSEPDGRLWIGVHDPGVFADRTEGLRLAWDNAWDIFESDGRYLGRIPVPDGFRLRVVTEQTLYGVWEDELEVPFARRYQVIREAGI